MTRRPAAEAEATPRLRDRTWSRFLKGPDPELIWALYEPGLAMAARYDRCCAYFTSSVLAVAARGFGPFVQRLYSSLPLPSGAEPPIRLLVNEELQPADVRALTERRDTSKLEALLAKRLVPPQDLAERRRFELLAWLVKEGLLEVRVGVMRSGVGILHAKFGLIYDGYGDALVFAGSGNESAQGLQASFEQVEVSGSWSDPERYARFAEDFETLWADTDPFVHTLPLPEAVRLKLIRYAPAEPPLADRPGDATVRQRAAMLWRFVASAPYLPTGGGAACDATALVDLWPHQGRVVRDTAEAWPDGRLLCDEVGMGKTVEAILTIRRLIAGRGVRRALLLLPAGLTLQWQGELREKGGLRWPRFENPNKLVWPDGREETATLAEALRKPFLLLSRETARSPENRQLLLQAKSWDLVLLDEAHAARRANQKEGEFNHATLLLELLRRLQLERRARGLMLLSATPMQTHPWEPWDLLTVLGEGGEWLADFGKVRAFYGAVAGLERGLLELSDARTTAALLHNDLEFPPYGGLCPQEVEPVVIERRLTMAPPGERPALARWLRHGSPLGRRMHRNTRATLRTYYQRGLLDQPPPRRVVDDIRFDFADRAEREVYEAVKGYIDRRFAELEGERPGKGFVMTIYRRRAASSPRALEMSLARRAEALEHVASRHAPDILLGLADVPEALDPDELPEELAGQVEAGLPTSPAAARRELEEVEALLSRLRRLNGADTKRERFFDALRRLTDDGRPALVFSEYVDTMDYLREQMVARYSDALACYSGRGGEVYEGGAWQPVSKAEITRRLRARSIQVLLCTDAASEGLNLQAASALVCFDLPWNPSRVEQRIGRIDRIGQEAAEVRITNLFLKDSIDDRVYSVLRERCQLFEAFVGPMQPVLARARRMLIGNPQDADVADLDAVARETTSDRLVGESYLEDEVSTGSSEVPALTHANLRAALDALRLVEGTNVRVVGDVAQLTLKRKRRRFALRARVLEEDPGAIPLTPLSQEVQELADTLERPGEQLPLVVRSAASGAFRAVACLWVDEAGKAVTVPTFGELQTLIKGWSGAAPSPSAWQAAALAAQAEADAAVETIQRRASAREDAALARQVQAAQLRLLRELARHLLAHNPAGGDLNTTLYDLMSGQRADGRIRVAFQRLDGYPTWPDALVAPLRAEVREMTEGQRKAVTLGKALDAALADPRWAAVCAPTGSSSASDR